MIKEPCAPSMGTDMEVFLKNPKTREIVPCVGLFEGTKEAPWTPNPDKPGFCIQEDNVMCEFNVPPTTSANTGRRFINEGIKMVRDAAGAHGLIPVIKADHLFKAKDLTSLQAQTIGCEGDYDAYNGGTLRESPPVLSNWRSCGGHIHLGGDFKCPDFVAALFAEYCLSVVTRYTCDKGARAKWYGQPGVFRPKPYGIEYRTIDNRWIGPEGNTELQYIYGLRLARWLSDTPTLNIQRAFRAIPWTVQREYMLSGNEDQRREVMQAAAAHGVPS